MVDFRFWENISFHITIMHGETLPVLWGVTLPDSYESGPGEQAGTIKEIEWGVSGRPLAVARRNKNRPVARTFY
jgi:hypothetical protein